MTDLSTSDEWRALARHLDEIEGIDLRQMFATDPNRVGALSLGAGDLHVDFSKQRITPHTVALLAELARRADLPARIEAMFSGEPVNPTENQPALHTALRAGPGTVVEVDGHDVMADVRSVLTRAAELAEAVRSRRRLGHSGEPIRNVVNIGIGGSDLGPAMAYAALRPHRHPGIECRFVSNVDGADLTSALHGLDPASTLFVVSSKTFTTTETMANARSARRWLLEGSGAHAAAVAQQFVAVSANPEAVAEFGIDPANTFEMWDWVGGRYSLASAIGLSLMIAIGPEAFRDMLAGFASIDAHFRSAPIEHNLPAMLGLIGIWNRDFFGWGTNAVIPYSADLGRFPAYLQQLEMESNGKRVRLDGSPVGVPTAPVVWGEPGTNGQHAFFQLLHQGTDIVPADFIAACRPAESIELEDAPGDHHDLLMANCLAQSQALAFGRSEAEVRATGTPEDLVAHRTFPGNRPSTTILLPELSPSTLGQLVALYEHKVFTQGVLWQVNSFDQWGVELGKQLATGLTPHLTGPEHGASGLDASTSSLVAHYRSQRGRGR